MNSPRKRCALATFAIAILAVTFFTTAARADALILHDGTRIEGKIHKDGDQWIVTDATGKETAVPADRIESFERGNRHPNHTPAQQLASLRASAAKLSSLNEIISRYQNFLKKITDDADTIAQANDDLTQWKQRAADGDVKVGGQWLSPAERDALVASEADAAAHIGDLIKQDRLQDAADAVKTALQLDPKNPAALYLNGLLLAKQNQNPPARAAFEQVAKIVPGHAPTENNLAIILWRQSLYTPAMNAYVQAMQASPANKIILDNVAEALNAIPDENKDNPPVVKAAAMFADQDKTLQDAQAANGMVRWGATWVPSDQLGRLQTEELQNQTQLATLADDYNRTKNAIASDESQIQSDQQEINQAQAWTSNNLLGVQGAHGAIQGLPQNYNQNQILQDIQLMSSARNHSQEHLNHIVEEINRIQQNLSVPKYTGNLDFIGPEGTPIPAGAPATQPS
jgi:Flp pilus assembly protein TadD